MQSNVSSAGNAVVRLDLAEVPVRLANLRVFRVI